MHTLVHTRAHTDPQTHLCTGAHTHWYPCAHLYMRTHRPPCTKDPSPHAHSGFQDSPVGVTHWVPGPPSSGAKTPHCPRRRSPTPCHKTFKGAACDHKLVFHGSSGSPVCALCRHAQWALTSRPRTHGRDGICFGGFRQALLSTLNRDAVGPQPVASSSRTAGTRRAAGWGWGSPELRLHGELGGHPGRHALPRAEVTQGRATRSR